MIIGKNYKLIGSDKRDHYYRGMDKKTYHLYYDTMYSYLKEQEFLGEIHLEGENKHGQYADDHHHHDPHEAVNHYDIGT